ncbi:MAG: Gfo/Idh/MocA family oxidoreductase [Armatimonadetes bacterium]|nr:Gfo/Idh/MocA family oxidoreductase [Armatimonadota bacterium]MDW8029059.1 Gfo/Idh/MocA family oxidoreductase [Armatimonadota bacterium]
MRIGFIGCGGIANLHMNNLSRMEGVELVAFCDVDESRAKEAANRFKGNAYTDHKAMFDREQLDAVYICIPPHAHTDQEILAAQRGIAIFVEKPIARNLDKALEILEAIRKSGVINCVGYHFRYFDGTDLAKERLTGKTVGMVMGYWMGGLPGVYWWRKLEMSGGQIVEQTTHIFDLARYIVGDIVRVSSATALRALQGVPDLNVPDVGVVNVWFENGAIGCIANTCMLKMGYNTGLHVITQDLIVEISGVSTKFIEPNRTEEIRHQRNGHFYESFVFVEAVKTKNQSLIRSDYSDAVKTLSVTLAALKSAERNGEPVEVPKF